MLYVSTVGKEEKENRGALVLGGDRKYQCLQGTRQKFSLLGKEPAKRTCAATGKVFYGTGNNNTRKRAVKGNTWKGGLISMRTNC